MLRVFAVPGFGPRLRQLRRQTAPTPEEMAVREGMARAGARGSGLAMRELAARARLHPGSLARLETDRQQVTLAVALALAHALGVPLSTLVPDEAEFQRIPPRQSRGQRQKKPARQGSSKPKKES